MDLGLERAGWDCRWQVEIDRFCHGILARNWPDVRRRGDVRGIEPEWLGTVDLVCGGFPCQDISAAGKRAGLAGEQSGLWFEFRRLVAGLGPQWVLVENVPGLLYSSGGRDLATLLSGLGDLGYLSAWRVLNAKHFGVPQRRRRLFIVGSLGDGRAAQVLLDGAEAFRYSGVEEFREPVVACLRAAGQHHSGAQLIEDEGRLRNLTPMEWERLQGFPDGWTAGPRATDDKRYKALGNAVVPGVAEWIGRRIMECHLEM